FAILRTPEDTPLALRVCKKRKYSFLTIVIPYNFLSHSPIKWQVLFKANIGYRAGCITRLNQHAAFARNDRFGSSPDHKLTLAHDERKLSHSLTSTRWRIMP
ncbi:hypothetical protein ACTXK7_10735, partial [Vreelandella alkaliphila]|uniref:hypothetical protein n=1 Tax=Vreelandella alkaliphila TaxID=272774 RepID=UPI003FD70543